ncbi:MAG: pyridoxal-phosphate dependent enzyme [Microbispora sp.]|nr:pyridoxal-phosphate dependent enzyme [Microbispora sp.]
MGDPGVRGRFGEYGGRYAPESLAEACRQVDEAFRDAWADPGFRGALARLLAVHAGRPTPLTPAHRLSVGVEAEGGAGASRGRLGVLHGSRSLFLQDGDGQIIQAHSIAAGLDYPGVGPEHAHLRDLGRARYVTVTDDEAVRAAVRLARTEGIVPALESAHALAWVIRAADRGDLPAGSTVLMTSSGRGDKDVSTLKEML